MKINIQSFMKPSKIKVKLQYYEFLYLHKQFTTNVILRRDTRKDKNKIKLIYCICFITHITLPSIYNILLDLIIHLE
jgi:hypothetical protein